MRTKKSRVRRAKDATAARMKDSGVQEIRSERTKVRWGATGCENDD